MSTPIASGTLNPAMMVTGRNMAGVADEAGRAGRFRAIALPHLDALYTLARYLLGNAVDAEDAVQECCLRAFRHFDGFRGDAIKPWLLAILRNVCRAEYARRSGVVVGIEDETAEVTPVWSEMRASPEAETLQRHDGETIKAMIAGLPPAFREVIVLREINELNYREIAQVIDAPVGTVMSRLSRGRALLREAWIETERSAP